MSYGLENFLNRATKPRFLYEANGVEWCNGFFPVVVLSGLGSFEIVKIIIFMFLALVRFVVLFGPIWHVGGLNHFLRTLNLNTSMCHIVFEH